MKFRNPWIDPRIVQVKSADARAYLLHRGWKLVSPESEPLLHFEAPPGSGSETMVGVPMKEQARDYTQRIIELVTDLALAEDRYAVEILNDILHPATTELVSANGPGVSLPAESARK